MSTPFLRVIFLTLFPEIFPGPLGCSVLKKAQEKGLWSFEIINIRDFATDKHRTVDDNPYGGGPGMVMRPDIVHEAMSHSFSLLKEPQQAHFFYMSPRGKKLTQSMVQGLIKPLWPLWNKNLEKNNHPTNNINTHLSDDLHIQPLEWIVLCGRFEGIDERVLQHWKFEHISIGDYILCGGELPAMVFIESCLRLVPGVLGNPQSFLEESFSEENSYLEGPLYTRPEKFLSYDIPEVLLSGHHEKIRQWKQKEGYLWTKNHRPDLLKNKEFPFDS